MIKKYCINKLIISTFLLIIISIISILPNKNKIDIELEYEKSTNNVVYLLDKDNYVSKLNIYIGKNEIADIIKEKLLLLRDGSEDYPDFRTLIPKDTIINKIVVEKDTITIDFSKEFLSIKSSLIDSAIEAITYSLTEINGINNIYIYIEDKLLEEFPSGKKIEQPLMRSIGINNEYDLINLDSITKTTVYFIKKDNEDIYYVPVTLVNNDNREKIDIIISELKSSVYSVDNLYSYLSNNLSLDSYNKTEDAINLVFNDYIFESIGSKTILEEVKYVIGESILENYDVDEVVFNYGNSKLFSYRS